MLQALPKTRRLCRSRQEALSRLCAGIAAVLFALVVPYYLFQYSGHAFKDRLTESILSGITLAMAMIPEEFPVILTVFLSMGAWRLAKKHSLVRKLPAVETLGAVSVLCVDKTGTITMNQMTVRKPGQPTVMKSTFVKSWAWAAKQQPTTRWKRLC